MDVLVVDDSGHMRTILKELLRSMGMTSIREASNAADALAILQEYTVDIAMIDISMPGMDGLNLARHIRNDPNSSNPYLPILVISGHANLQAAQRARDAGVSEFLVKPITARGLYDRILAIIDRPRAFVRVDNYFGPDRRRRNDNRYVGIERRGRSGSHALDMST